VIDARPQPVSILPAAQEDLPLSGPPLQPPVRLETHDAGIAHLVFEAPPGKVNLLSAGVISLLEILVAQASGQRLRGLVVRSARLDQFVAGADVREIRALRSFQDAEQASRRGQRLFASLEGLPFPVVAAIGGACLGGGTELALACHYRVAADAPRVEIGLPEVKLGILPGWGGTQRLPRLLGLAPALDIILNGRSLDARRARAAGLVDDLAPPEILVQAAERLIEEAHEGARRPQRRLSDGPLARLSPWRRVSIAMTARVARQRLRARVDERHYPAPYLALEAVTHGLISGREEGFAFEAESLGHLAVGPTSRGLVALFSLQQEARRDPIVASRPRPIDATAVVGAGVMGGGIARALARSGFPVRLKDIDAQALARGVAVAHRLEEAELLKRRITRSERDRRLDRILPALEYSGFRRATVVIEAVVESLRVKHQVLRDLEAAAPEGFIFATNTSSIPIAAIAAPARRPDQVIGMHFFNPVHKMPLVEVIRGPQTSDETVATVVDLTRRIGKTPVVVGDAPGFLVNRILMTYLGEALLAFEEGGRVDDIDRALVEFGMPMGPFALLDQIGLDVAAHVAGVLTEAFPDRAPKTAVLTAMKEKGWLGRKSGRGFYLYAGGGGEDGEAPSSGPPRDVHAGATALRPAGRATGGGAASGAIESRLVLPMINEAARCLEADLVRDPAAVDLAMVLGAGFPPFRGGLLRHADTLGLPTVIQSLELLAGRLGTRFQPARLLLDLARSGRGFFVE
jgi:3-hydroxyacyl-CoA dehydrogenase/enoyl-CoA hydratase/3-hydroxybutyryl-CoA epimerase